MRQLDLANKARGPLSIKSAERSVQRAEKGQRVDPKFVKQVATALGVPVRELINHRVGTGSADQKLGKCDCHFDFDFDAPLTWGYENRA